MEIQTNRRRVLRVMALGTGAVMTPSVLWSKGTSAELYSWNGNALGAETSIQLYSNDQGQADDALMGAQKIIEKYEALFSLYNENSIIVTLNKTGELLGPHKDFVDLLMLSKSFYAETDGAFDITIQPLWTLYQDHFSGANKSHLEKEIAAVQDVIGSDHIVITDDKVTFNKPNMSVSFNGIAQGYTTDKVTEYLESKGFRNVLVDMGEYRAVGPQENGDPWRIGLLDPFDSISIVDVVEMKSGAVATSGGYGNQFDASGKYHHLFDPKTGLSSALYASVTVRADDATTADALSTAFSNMSQTSIRKVLGQYKNVDVRLTDQKGIIHRLHS